MSGKGADEKRAGRVQRVRDDWRRADQEARDVGAPDPSAGDEERRAESLRTMDRLRREAPEDDLETRRAGDALEREIERARREPRPPSGLRPT